MDRTEKKIKKEKVRKLEIEKEREMERKKDINCEMSRVKER